MQDNITNRSKVGRKGKEVKSNVKIVSYYSQEYVDKIKKFGSGIGSVTLSNSVRSIVILFLKNQ